MIENICNGLEPTCATIELVCRDGWPFSWLARQSLTQCREAALVDDWKRFSELQNLRISVQTKWVTHQSDDGTNQSSESPRLSEIRLCRKCQRLALVCADSVYNPLVGQADTAFRVQWRLQACLHSLTNHCFACVPLRDFVANRAGSADEDGASVEEVPGRCLLAAQATGLQYLIHMLMSPVGQPLRIQGEDMCLRSLFGIRCGRRE